MLLPLPYSRGSKHWTGGVTLGHYVENRSPEASARLITNLLAAAAAKSLHSCLTLCNPRDGSPPGSPIPGILQQEHWSGLPFPSPMHKSEKWKGSRSVMYDLATPWTTAYQAPPSMGFSRQEYWSGVPLPSPTNLLKWGIKLFLSHWDLRTLYYPKT